MHSDCSSRSKLYFFLNLSCIARTYLYCQGEQDGKLKIWDLFWIIYLIKDNCGGSVGRCPLCFPFFNWELKLILFVVGVFFKLLIVNFSRRKLVAIPVLSFWQGLELCYLLSLCNYIYKKAPYPAFV